MKFQIVEARVWRHVCGGELRTGSGARALEARGQEARRGQGARGPVGQRGPGGAATDRTIPRGSAPK